jgi:FimV-like protein
LNYLRAQFPAGGEAETATQPEVETVLPQPTAAADFVDLESIPTVPDELPIEEPAEAAAPTPLPAATVSASSTQDPATVSEERPAVSLVFRLMTVIAAAVGIIALLWTALSFWRRRTDAAVADDTVIRQTIDEQSDAGDTCRISAQFARVPDEDFVVYEEPVGKADQGTDDEFLLNEDDAHSLAQTGFHLAYESCDRAAAPVLTELEKDPDNRELKLRLTEVYFQWGNKAAFLDVAQELRAATGAQTDSVWDKVVIMGRQICPDEGLFAEATPSAGEIDVQLQGETSSALDLAFDEQNETQVDLDTGSADDAEPDAIDDAAATVRAEATEEFIARSQAMRDSEKTADLAVSSAELDASTVAIVHGGERPHAEASPTVTQEWHGIDASATLEEPADVSSTTVVSESPDSAVIENSDDDTASQSLLAADDTLEGGAGDRAQGLALVDEFVTTLDLAKAYVSIGQPELAIPMLEEALQAADGQQTQEARQMLEEALSEATAAAAKTKRSA